MQRMVVSGALNWDINLFVDRFPTVGEEVSVRSITRVPGGTGANVSVAASRLLAPGVVSFIGCLGSDTIAEEQIRILKDEGVDTSGVKVAEGEESGQAYITIDQEGRNCIHTYFGANLHLTPEDVRKPPQLKLVENSGIIIIMDPPLETAERIAQLGKASGSIVIWDPGVYAELGLGRLTSGLQNTDYFILSSLEFGNLLGTTDSKKVGEALGAFGDGLNIVMKQGAEGCSLIRHRGANVLHLPTIHLEALGMKVVNTVGCGDAFIGAFAAAKVLGHPDPEALMWANCAGALKATRAETRGSPRRAELEENLRKARRLMSSTDSNC